MADGHVPVLLDATLELLAPEPGAAVVDCTGGGGGHARALAERMDRDGRLVVLDRDPTAVRRLRECLGGVRPRVDCVHADFRDLAQVLDDLDLPAVDRLLADLGFSSSQVDDPARGLSFQAPGPLDMRMDPTTGPSADRWVNRVPESELAGVIADYGEERFAARVAAAIVAARPIRDTITLAEVVRRAVPRPSGKLDRATRTFQALRIAVNDELGALDALLDAGLAALAPGGRMAVISFHGLETKRVKTAFRGAVKAGRVTLLTPKPIRPLKAEVRDNRRARSAVLRAVERVR